MSQNYMADRIRVIDEDSDNAYMELLVWKEFGDVVSISEKGKTLDKFGYSQNVGTSRTTIASFTADIANETYLTTNAIDSISSADDGDDQVVVIEYHTVSGGQFTFARQAATLNGNTRVALTPGARVSRLINPGNSGSAFTGPLYVYENTAISTGKPTDTSKIHMTVFGEPQRSEKGASTISKADYWFPRSGGASLGNKNAAVVDVFMQVRRKGGVFEDVAQLTVSTDNPSADWKFKDSFLIVPKNADFRYQGICRTQTAAEVFVNAAGPLGVVQIPGSQDGSYVIPS